MARLMRALERAPSSSPRSPRTCRGGGSGRRRRGGATATTKRKRQAHTIIVIGSPRARGISIAFEKARETLEEATSENMKPILNSIFAELTLLGFIGLELIFIVFQQEAINARSPRSSSARRRRSRSSPSRRAWCSSS